MRSEAIRADRRRRAAIKLRSAAILLVILSAVSLLATIIQAPHGCRVLFSPSVCHFQAAR